MTRYPFDALERLVRVQVSPELGRNGQHLGVDRSVAGVLGTSPRQLYRWRRIGVTADQAETLALRAGYLPYEVWPEIIDHVEAERRARNAAAQRRAYQQRPEVREAKVAASRAYYEACREYVKARERAKYQRERDRINARRRERYANDPEYRARRLREAASCAQDDRESMVA